MSGTSTPPVTTITLSTTCNACQGINAMDQVIFGDVKSTKTTLINPLGSFSWNAQNSGIYTEDLPTGYLYIPTLLTIGDIVISSPTAYNVFTGFSFVTVVQEGSVCATTTLSGETLATVITYPVPVSTRLGIAEVIIQAESSFISELGSITCPTRVATTTVTATGTSSEGIPAIPGTITTLSTKHQTNNTTSATSNEPTSTKISTASATPDSNPGLSQSTKTWFGIGIGIGSVIVVVLAGLLIWKHKLRKKLTAPKPSTQLPFSEYSPAAELLSRELYPPAELIARESYPAAEMEHKNIPQELSVERRPELE